jgi:hypothetical protein
MGEDSYHFAKEPRSSLISSRREEEGRKEKFQKGHHSEKSFFLLI